MLTFRGGSSLRRWAVGICAGIAFWLLSTEPVRAANAALANTTVAVETGVQYELDHKWIAAIEHYKEALKAWPENDALKFGLRRSRIHLGIEKRYLDESFEAQLLPLSEAAALDQWSEVYDLVQRNYIERISPTSFLAHGTESLYLGLANPKFLSEYRLNPEDERVIAMRRLLREVYWNKPVADAQQARRVISEVARLCQQRMNIPSTAVVMEYVFGSSTVLDDYSAYLTPDKLGDLFASIEGEFVGLGIEIKSADDKGILLVNVLPGSPAEAGGARAGDIIVGIDEHDCRGMQTEKAASLLKGTSGSQVRMTLQGRDGKVRGPLTFVRREVHVNSVPVAKMLDRENGIGYIKLTAFQKSSVEELDTAMRQLQAQGMKSLVWDLRGNPGGLLTTAVEIMDRFLDRGTVVSIRGRNKVEDWNYSAHAAGTWRGELVLLIDENSASASEIAAGAIKDHRRGTIVGRTSYGKWSVQTIMNASHSTGMRLTTAKFYSPTGKTYSGVGLSPDVAVTVPEEHSTFYRGPETLNETDDADIRQGLQILRQKLSQR
jgi:carboxyl-terminal processing protease